MEKIEKLEIIKGLRKLYYKDDEQRKFYAERESSFSNKAKYSLIDGLLISERGFWGCFPLLCHIALEISDDSDRFMFLLSKIEKKNRNNIALRPFIDLLRKIGSKKFALNLYKRITNSQNLENEMKIISGTILGAYSLYKSSEELNKRLKEGINHPMANSYLRAISVFCDNQEISCEIIQFFDRVLESKDPRILTDLVFLSLDLYKKGEKEYFYKIVETIIRFKVISTNRLIFTLLGNILTKDHFFKLIDEVKGYDFDVIKGIIRSFGNYPKEHKKIISLLVYWIDKAGVEEVDLEFRWVLEDLVQRNKNFVEEFFKRYGKMDMNKKWQLLNLSSIFEMFFQHHHECVLEQILKFKNKDDNHLFFELCLMFAISISQDEKNEELVIKLNEDLIDLAKSRGYISFNEQRYRNKLSEIEQRRGECRSDYDYLVDKSKDLLDRLMQRKRTYDFSLIRKNLSKYKNIEEISKDFINELEKSKKFSPLLWLGESEEPKLEPAKKHQSLTELGPMDIIQEQRRLSVFWPRAYLKELNLGIKKYLESPNETEYPKRRILKNFSEEGLFWAFQSELIFINRFPKLSIISVEPRSSDEFGKKLDLKVCLLNKNMYFEITRPKLLRALKLSNSVSGPNRVPDIIQKKVKQMPRRTNNDLFFLVIDASESEIDDIHIRAGLSDGNLVDKLRTSYKIPVEILSGIIFFRQRLVIEGKNQAGIRLDGDIVNMNGKNKFNDEEVKKLREIIFR